MPNIPVEDVETVVHTLLATQFDITRAQCTPDAKIVDDLGAGSLDVIEMMIQIEDMFGIEIPDDEAQKLTTVGELVTYLEKRMQEKTQ